MKAYDLIGYIRQDATTVLNGTGFFVDIAGKSPMNRANELQVLTASNELPVIALGYIESSIDVQVKTNTFHKCIMVFLNQGNPDAGIDQSTGTDSIDLVCAEMESLAYDFLKAFFSSATRKTRRYMESGKVKMTREKNILNTTLSGVSIEFTLTDNNVCF